MLLVEQEFLSEKNLEIVKERLKHEVTTCNVRTIARKRRHDVGTLEEDATAIFARRRRHPLATAKVRPRTE